MVDHTRQLLDQQLPFRIFQTIVEVKSVSELVSVIGGSSMGVLHITSSD